MTHDVYSLPPGLPEPVRGLAAWKGVISSYFAAFPDLRHRPHRVTTGDNEVACLVEVTGTHTEDLAFPDGSSLPPTGASVRVELAEFWRYEGDRIAEYKVIYDQADFLAQLGVRA